MSSKISIQDLHYKTVNNRTFRVLLEDGVKVDITLNSGVVGGHIVELITTSIYFNLFYNKQTKNETGTMFCVIEDTPKNFDLICSLIEDEFKDNKDFDLIKLILDDMLNQAHNSKLSRLGNRLGNKHFEPLLKRIINENV